MDLDGENHEEEGIMHETTSGMHNKVPLHAVVSVRSQQRRTLRLR